MNPTYRADHIGSFLRPSGLLEARKNARQDELRTLEDQQILRVLAIQKELGFELATDGEFRRRNFMSDFTDAVEGFDLGEAVGRTWNTGQPGSPPVSSITGIPVRANSPFEKYRGVGSPGIARGKKAIVAWVRKLRGR
jgi:5-methyltetrahydropteroyltriglutamate--homocysteine methyltransferase